MAYNVSQNYRVVVYSGESLYDCRLKINDNLIPINQIETIKISSPIIDTTTDTGSMFHIGTFISQTLDIKFKNLNGLDLTNNPLIELEIGLYVDNAYEYVPIGKYLIDELAEDYQTTCQITCLDYAIKFKSNLDISQFFNESGYILASDLFEAICGYYGITVGTYPNVNNNKQIYTYDGTLTGKQYISYLAELFGGNAKIERDGSCSIIPLKNYTNIEIDALQSKSFKIGDTYELSRVCYDNGVLKLQAGGNVISVESLPVTNIDTNSYYYLIPEMKYYQYENSQWVQSTTIKNTLYIRSDNLFIAQQSEITNIYNAVKDFSITNITCENRMDLSLDCWDIIKYTTVDGNYYYTFYDNEINFNGTTMGKNTVNLPLKTTEETTNIITANTNAKIRRIQTIVNEQNLQIQTITEEVGEYDYRISVVEQTVDEIQSEISDIADVTESKESETATVLIDNVNESEPVRIVVHPIIKDISFLYPRINLYPSSTLYMPIRTIRFTRTYEEDEETKTENIDYEIPDNLFYYDEDNYDEFILDYTAQTCVINKKVGYNSSGETYVLPSPTTISYTYPTIELGSGDYTISLLGYNQAYIFARLMIKNLYTDQFATKAELNSKITQTTESINSSVDQKLTNYSTTSQMNSAINQKANEITSSVSETYITKTDSATNINTAKNEAINQAVNTSDTNTDTKLTNYSTVTQLNSAITQSANEITSSVSETYTTKNEMIDKLGEYATTDDVQNVSNTVATLQTTTNYAISIAEDVRENGVSKVQTEKGFTFDNNGLTIDETNSKTKNVLDTDGLEILDKTGNQNEVLLRAKYDENTGETVVESKNMIVHKFFVVADNSRIEKYDNGAGMFWIGG